MDILDNILDPASTVEQGHSGEGLGTTRTTFTCGHGHHHDHPPITIISTITTIIMLLLGGYPKVISRRGGGLAKGGVFPGTPKSDYVIYVRPP